MPNPPSPATEAPTAAPSGSATACRHCGLPVPAALYRLGEDDQFCCSGCHTVFALLQRHGLDQFYALQGKDEARQARVTGRAYGELDNPAFVERYVKVLADGSHEAELYLEGVHCSACVWLVERLPRIEPGVVAVRLDFGRQLATVRWDPRTVALSQAAGTLDRLGYPVHPYRGASRRELRRREDRRLLVRLAVAGAVAGNVMLMAAAMYADVFGEMSGAQLQFFRWASLVTSAPAVFFSGSVFLRGAWSALRLRALHMDLPIAIGIVAGFVWGAVNTVRGVGAVYFDSVTSLVFLLLVGRLLQQRQQRSASDAAELLFSLTPTRARVLSAGQLIELPIEAVEAGALVEVLAGETVPVDGRVREGESKLNAALLSGESRPVSVRSGDTIHAGTLNLAARLLIEVAAAGEATRVGQLLRRIEEYTRRKPPVVRLADRIAGYFVASTIGLAFLTIGLWWAQGADQAIERGIALLIVTCPCALGLATPLAISVAVGRAARRGILIKGGDAIERLVRPGVMVLDKTGTLTEGGLALAEWWGSERLLRMVAALEAHSAHPVARALVAEVPGGDFSVSAVQETQGGGIRGIVNGVIIELGTLDYLGVSGDELPPNLQRAVADCLAHAHSPVLVRCGGDLAGCAAFGDPLAADAASTVARLKALGWELWIISGDHPQIVATVGREVGVAAERCVGAATPEQKLAHVRTASRRGPVVMVGDGVNDAAALSSASCGIAVHGGAEASLAAADVFLGRPGLAAVADLVDGARATIRVIRVNIAFSLLYNLVGAGLAIGGAISPLIAALLMPLSSLTVVTYSFRARTF